MSADWKDHHANEANKALNHPLMVGVLEEYADNMNFDAENGLPAYGMRKIARYAAMVARAQALGFEPDLLRMTPSEATSHQLELAANAALLGIPVQMMEDGS